MKKRRKVSAPSTMFFLREILVNNNFLVVKKNLEEKFQKIAERIITLALETADYDEDRAEQFLNATISEERKPSDENCVLIMSVFMIMW